MILGSRASFISPMVARNGKFGIFLQSPLCDFQFYSPRLTTQHKMFKFTLDAFFRSILRMIRAKFTIFVNFQFSYLQWRFLKLFLMIGREGG